MTDDAVRTYAVGDQMGDAYRPRNEGACWEQHAGYGCNLPTGHKGPQHVAAVRMTGGGEVVSVWDRDTSGDEPKRYAVGDTAPLSIRASGAYCGKSTDTVGHYYTCSLPVDHDGPQHLTIDGASGRVVAAVDVPEPIVEQPTPEVVAERLRVVEEEVVQLRSIRDRLLVERDEAYADRNALQATHDQLRQDVVDKAMELARRHDWCSVVQQGLQDMGLGDLLERTFRITVAVRAERTVTVQVKALDGDSAWRAVDNMTSSELAEAYEEENGGSFDRDVMGGGDWELQSQDASTSTEEI